MNGEAHLDPVRDQYGQKSHAHGRHQARRRARARTVPLARLVRCRRLSSGRYLSLAISSADLGSYFRWGVPQAYVKPLGSRRWLFV